MSVRFAITRGRYEVAVVCNVDLKRPVAKFCIRVYGIRNNQSALLSFGAVQYVFEETVKEFCGRECGIYSNQSVLLGCGGV